MKKIIKIKLSDGTIISRRETSKERFIKILKENDEKRHKRKASK